VDPITILLIILTVYVAWRLRSVLGQRTDNERPPQDFGRFSRHSSQTKSHDVSATTAEDKTPFALPSPITAQSASAKGKMFRWKDITEPDSSVAQGLDSIAQHEPNFDAKHFLEGAKIAYEMVINAFSSGDRETLKTLLTPAIYKEFDTQLRAREEKNVSVSTTFVGLDKAEIVKVAVDEKAGPISNTPPKGYVTLHFLAQLLTNTHTKDGTIVEGSAEDPIYVDDFWTFTRPLGIGEVNWAIAETRSAQSA
jgi:predicted lipid-binding transport protein (Tim44 family)